MPTTKRKQKRATRNSKPVADSPIFSWPGPAIPAQREAWFAPTKEQRRQREYDSLIAETSALSAENRALKQKIKFLEPKLGRANKENFMQLEKYGELLSYVSNARIKEQAMLGQVLKGLYILGITPDVIMAKCQQMFCKKVSAD